MQFLALTSSGIEPLLAVELANLGADVGKQGLGTVAFSADLATAYKICLWSRLATRVIMHIASAKDINDKTALYNFAAGVDWSQWFNASKFFLVDVTGVNRELKNSQFTGLVIKDAIVDHFVEQEGRRPSVDKESPDVQVLARLHRDVCDLYFDFSGPSLHQRGYRRKTGAAPIKEHLAAALVLRSGWLNDITQPLFDPCCGSATLLIEAAHLAQHRAPGLDRKDFAFMRLPGFRRALFDEQVTLAKAQFVTPNLHLFGHDIDASVLQKAEHGIAQAGLTGQIQLSEHDVTQGLAAPNRVGVMISNLPYGERIGSLADVVQLHALLGSYAKKLPLGWHLALFSGNQDMLKLLKLAKHKEYKFKNGNLDCSLCLYEINEQQVATRKAEGQQALHFDASAGLANRIQKNMKALKKYVEQHDLEAYRIYDADIPEYNFAIDKYHDYVVIYEYAPPKHIEAESARKRLQDAILVVSQTLNVGTDKIALKVREVQKGKAQYQVLEKKRQEMLIYEQGLKFIVNLFDYLDTGLFIDHRPARQKLRELSQGKRVLNLFAYTGSASVYAAAGGAKSVTTVDMSNTYLGWAEDNMAENGFTGRQYQYVQADCLAWLASEAGHSQYDVIFLDPPTFSNSKRMDNNFDVQRDHIELLSTTAKLLAADGVVLFSNNKRGFKMDHEALAKVGLVAEDWTEQSIPLDFKRNKHIHNAWLVRHG